MEKFWLPWNPPLIKTFPDNYKGYYSDRSSPARVCGLNHVPNCPVTPAPPSFLQWFESSAASNGLIYIAYITVSIFNVSLCLPWSWSRGHLSHSRYIPDIHHLHTHHNIFPLLRNIQLDSLKGSRLYLQLKGIAGRLLHNSCVQLMYCIKHRNSPIQ